MEVILLEKVSKVGELGAKVKVKPGFGRNYLIPSGKALPATKKNIEFFETRRAELEKKANQRLAQAQERAKAIEGINIVITAQAGDEGKLFGSVGAHEIIEALQAKGHEVSKNEVRFSNGALRQIGEYELELHLLGDEVTAKISVTLSPA